MPPSSGRLWEQTARTERCGSELTVGTGAVDLQPGLHLLLLPASYIDTNHAVHLQTTGTHTAKLRQERAIEQGAWKKEDSTVICILKCRRQSGTERRRELLKHSLLGEHVLLLSMFFDVIFGQPLQCKLLFEPLDCKRVGQEPRSGQTESLVLSAKRVPK